MTRFIELGRHFRHLTQAELDEPELLASANDETYLRAVSWPQLIEYPRVLILAEAGSGKTAEMRAQVARLRNEGKLAFFLALESLDQGQLIDLLDAGEEEAFNIWKAEGRTKAWFFLDAVDELKLTQGKLERALGRFAKAISGLLNQAHIVISSRPLDWKPTLDLAIFEEKLPFASLQPAPPPEDEVFLAALRETGRSNSETVTGSSRSVQTVVLLPMSERQIETFSASLGVTDTTAFIEEIRKQDAWTFARRPLDLSELVATWNSVGTLGTRAQQHEVNAEFKLKDDPDRPDAGLLSNSRAREGGERLALALALTRTRTIRSPEQELDAKRAEGVLDPSEVLRDWDAAQRGALLRRALFDPATYGRVRFHHRSVQEYLAARRLSALREKGLSTKALFRFLFAERYGVSVVLPSMRPIAAWLALWDVAVLNELMRREPEALLSMGDPESLTLEARATLLQRFADAYGSGGWRGLRIAGEELRRLAHPELAETINRIWAAAGPANNDVRALLLDLIHQGGIAGCADLAEHAAVNGAFTYYERTVAVRALVASNELDKMRRIAESICNEPAKWPDRVIFGVVANLFPAALNVSELLGLVQRTREPRHGTGGFTWQMREVAQSLDPVSGVASELQTGLAYLIWSGRAAEQRFYEISGNFDYLAPALAIMCHRRLAVLGANSDSGMLRACAIANRFANDESGDRETLGKLRTHFSPDRPLRAAAFWIEMELMDELTAPRSDWDRMYFAEHDGLIAHFVDSDRSWLEAALVDHTQRARRAVALQALARLWMGRGRVESEGLTLVQSVLDDAGLRAEAERLTAPGPENIEIRRMERNNTRRRRVREARELLRLEDWKRWRESLRADPDTAFSAGEVELTISNLYKWLSARPGAHNRYDVWDRQAIVLAFGEDIAARATQAFRQYWRTVRPELWSQRAPEQRDSTPWVWLYGLAGIAAEASSEGWANRLTCTDAAAAAAYGLLELNGFPAWLSELISAHPSQVDSVLGAELAAQLAVAAHHQHLPMLQDLTHAEESVKRFFAPRCMSAFMAWPAPAEDDESRERSARHIGDVLSILAEVSDVDQRLAIADACAVRFRNNRESPLGLMYLRGLFRFDAVAGAEALRDGLANLDPAIQAQRSVEFLASLFGDREGVPLAITETGTRARTLGQLLRSAYQYVRPQDDQRHDGVYTPNTRDHAESARNYLLQALIDTPGPEARSVILELADDPLFAHFPDRLRYLARERAAKDAEFEAFTPAQIAELEAKLELPPHDRDGLFSVMVDRLGDLAHDVAHHDFTDRRTLRAIEEESEMQVTLARRLHDMAKGAYIVVREDEVADKKKNDIRIAARVGDHRAAIEVKIADSWSIPDLERALRDQLAGQYLRHSNCKAGCLLLTFHGRKSYWEHPTTRAHLSFPDVVQYLTTIGESMETNSNHDYRLSVFGLNLTDPLLAPAHR